MLARGAQLYILTHRPRGHKVHVVGEQHSGAASEIAGPVFQRQRMLARLNVHVAGDLPVPVVRGHIAQLGALMAVERHGEAARRIGQEPVFRAHPHARHALERRGEAANRVPHRHAGRVAGQQIRRAAQMRELRVQLPLAGVLKIGRVNPDDHTFLLLIKARLTSQRNEPRTQSGRYLFTDAIYARISFTYSSPPAAYQPSRILSHSSTSTSPTMILLICSFM